MHLSNHVVCREIGCPFVQPFAEPSRGLSRRPRLRALVPIRVPHGPRRRGSRPVPPRCPGGAGGRGPV